MIDFIIIGAQKAGSTFLHRALEVHPDVYLPKDEERAFEDPEFSRGRLQQLQALLSRKREPVKGIKRPDYFAKHETIGRIYREYPDAKLILVLRDPVSRFYSAYFHLLKLGFLPIESPDVGIEKVLSGSYYHSHKKSRELIDYGMYSKHLSQWLSVFPKQNIKIIFDFELKDNNSDVVDSVFDYLGVARVKLNNVKPSKANKGVYSLLRLRFINLRNTLVFRYNEDKTKYDRRSGLGPLLNLLIVGFDRLVLFKLVGQGKPELSAKHRRMLVEHYKDDISQLERICDVNLGAWCE